MKTKSEPAAAPSAAKPTGALPRAFKAPQLAAHLGVPTKVVLRMGFPKTVLGTRTHIYLLDDVLAHIEKISQKAKGGAK